jgi:hypothetical protein
LHWIASPSAHLVSAAISPARSAGFQPARTAGIVPARTKRPLSRHSSSHYIASPLFAQQHGTSFTSPGEWRGGTYGTWQTQFSQATWPLANHYSQNDFQPEQLLP